MTSEDKARFLDACPHLLDDLQMIDKKIGRKPQCDWNATWLSIIELLAHTGSKWKVAEEKLFRTVFTRKDRNAEPVAIYAGTGFEADPDLRDFENVSLKDDVKIYFQREVRPYVPDAWVDYNKSKVGYEVNFNRHFYKYIPPRSLEQIDAELKQAEEKISKLLSEVTS